MVKCCKTHGKHSEAKRNLWSHAVKRKGQLSVTDVLFFLCPRAAASSSQGVAGGPRPREKQNSQSLQCTDCTAARKTKDEQQSGCASTRGEESFVHFIGQRVGRAAPFAPSICLSKEVGLDKGILSSLSQKATDIMMIMMMLTTTTTTTATQLHVLLRLAKQ